MTAYLVSVALGPVQEFISASRKTRDLWFGSTLLSESARAAAESLRAHHAELIFPWLPEDKSDAATGGGAKANAPGRVPVANKLLAIVPDGVEPKVLAKEAEKAARGILFGYLHALKEELRGAPVDWDLAEAQAGAFLEFYAAWWPYDGTGAQYQETRARVERLLAGRKALRDFAPADGQDGRAKSSLDPSRETVFRGHDGRPIGAGRGLDDNAKRWLHVKGAEQLDGVSLVKRLAAPHRFVSISRVTLDPFIRRLATDPEAGDALAHLRRQAKGLDAEKINAVESFEADEGTPLHHFAAFPFDTQLFYREGAAGEELTPDQQEAAKKFFERADAARKALQIPELPIYVAVVVADGDRMGKAISDLPDKTAHKALSERLATFARVAQTITARHQGAFVYSGGDDVLAFLPLDTVLDYVNQLHAVFWQIANDKAAGAPAEVGDLTLSVGVAIGHYHEPLRNLLRWARDAEHAAKGSRNALAVSLHTGSGGETATTVVHSWTEDPVATRWQTWVEWYRRDAFPDGAAYELRALEMELRPLWRAGPDPALRELLGREVRRILLRKQPEHGGRQLSAAEIGTLMGLIASRAATEATAEPREGDASHDADLPKLRTLVDELIIARRIATVTDVALGPITTGKEARDGGVAER